MLMLPLTTVPAVGLAKVVNETAEPKMAKPIDLDKIGLLFAIIGLQTVFRFFLSVRIHHPWKVMIRYIKGASIHLNTLHSCLWFSTTGMSAGLKSRRQLDPYSVIIIAITDWMSIGRSHVVNVQTHKTFNQGGDTDSDTG